LSRRDMKISSMTSRIFFSRKLMSVHVNSTKSRGKHSGGLQFSYNCLLFVKNIVNRGHNLRYYDGTRSTLKSFSWILSHSLRAFEIIPLDLSRWNVVVEFRPITVVVVVSLTVDSRFWYGFDGWHNLRSMTKKRRESKKWESSCEKSNYKITKL